jgi:hypothetical protein
MIRFELDRPIVACEGFVETLQCLQRCAAVVVGLGHARIQSDGRIDLPKGFGMKASLEINDAQEMKAAEMIGLRFEHSPVNRFRFAQMPRPMKPDRICERAR